MIVASVNDANVEAYPRIFVAGRPPTASSLVTKIYGLFRSAGNPLGKYGVFAERTTTSIYRPLACVSPETNARLGWFPVSDVPRMEKSPLLANGYNHPPTHLSHMQFMQLSGHPGAGHTAILSPASLPHHLQAQAQARAEQGLKVNPNMSNMEALAR